MPTRLCAWISARSSPRARAQVTSVSIRERSIAMLEADRNPHVYTGQGWILPAALDLREAGMQPWRCRMLVKCCGSVSAEVQQITTPGPKDSTIAHLWGRDE